jgi:hypothetical protein
MRKTILFIALIFIFSKCAVSAKKAKSQNDSNEADANTPDVLEHDIAFQDLQTDDINSDQYSEDNIRQEISYPDQQTQADNMTPSDSEDAATDSVELNLYYCEQVNYWADEFNIISYTGCCGQGFKTVSKPEPGMLIKGISWAAIYYYANDEKRYVFPYTAIL